MIRLVTILFALIAYTALVPDADEGCTTDSECMAQCETNGQKNCHLLFDGEEGDE